MASIDFMPKGWQFFRENTGIANIAVNLKSRLAAKYPYSQQSVVSTAWNVDDAPTGDILVYLEEIPLEKVEEYVSAAKQELKDMNMDIDENTVIAPYQEYLSAYPDHQQQVLAELKRKGKTASSPYRVTITITRNHEEEAMEIKRLFRDDAAPSANFNDVYAYQMLRIIDVPFENELNVATIQGKLPTAIKEKEEQIKELSVGSQEWKLIDYDIRNLYTLQELVTWCIRHNYKTIEVVK